MVKSSKLNGSIIRPQRSFSSIISFLEVRCLPGTNSCTCVHETRSRRSPYSHFPDYNYILDLSVKSQARIATTSDFFLSTSGIIMLRLSVFFLFLPDAVHSETSVFTKLGAALWTSVDDVFETIKYKWNPHTTVTSAIKSREEVI